ncbi:MAG: hypothetical protein ACOCZB_00225 [Spirochaetota bacterium]
MNDSGHRLALSHSEVVSLYLFLSRHEAELDELQTAVLSRVAAQLYSDLSVSEMEEIDAYYDALLQRR